jgi:AcrR family transcriptional regulator
MLKRAANADSGRRRGVALETALLDAAWAELHAVGYARVTMEAIALRAGTSRAVLYRRWRTRHELVLAALRRNQPMLSGEVPNTGSLRGDVLALLHQISAHLFDIGIDTLRGLLGDFFSDGQTFAELQASALEIGSNVMHTIVERAADRGELRRNIPSRVVTLPTDLFRHELFVTRAPPSERVITEIVDELFVPLARP